MVISNFSTVMDFIDYTYWYMFICYSCPYIYIFTRCRELKMNFIIKTFYSIQDRSYNTLLAIHRTVVKTTVGNKEIKIE